MNRILLSPPDVGETELELVREAIESGWVVPLGPQVDAFEAEFADVVEADHAVAVSSGTAALHLSLLLAGVEAGNEVLCSDLTFVASANPIRYVNAVPVFIDSEERSWNLDAALVAERIEDGARRGRPPKAVVAAHVFGQTADMDALVEACERNGVVLIEDAAEALGATYRGRPPGSHGLLGVFSFNGNKMITTSGGGMLVTGDERLARRARKLATQAREPVPHYEHRELGFNYRLSNVLAALGRAQLRSLDSKVAARRAVYARYELGFRDLPGLAMQPEADWGRHSRWLTVIRFDGKRFGATPEDVRRALDQADVEARPVWKPMHLQPLYEGVEVVGGTVAEDLFATGLCLPSGSALAEPDQERVIEVIRGCQRA